MTSTEKLPPPSAVGVASVTAGLSNVIVRPVPGGHRLPETLNGPPGSTTMIVTPSAGRSMSMITIEPGMRAKIVPLPKSMRMIGAGGGEGLMTTIVVGENPGQDGPV